MPIATPRAGTMLLFTLCRDAWETSRYAVFRLKSFEVFDFRVLVLNALGLFYCFFTAVGGAAEKSSNPGVTGLFLTSILHLAYT